MHEKAALAAASGPRSEWHPCNGSPLGGCEIARVRDGLWEFLCPDGKVRSGRFDKRLAWWSKQERAYAALAETLV
jgi:hypothetical protein